MVISVARAVNLYFESTVMYLDLFKKQWLND